jgi:hypothetical protein
MVQDSVHLYDIATLFASLQRTRVLHRANVVNAILDLVSDAEETVDICGNSSFPFAIFYYESMKQAISNAGKKQRYILELILVDIIYYLFIYYFTCAKTTPSINEINATPIIPTRGDTNIPWSFLNLPICWFWIVGCGSYVPGLPPMPFAHMSRKITPYSF